MSKRPSIKAEFEELAAVLKEQAYSQPEVADLLNPRAFELQMHPFTRYLAEKYPQFKQLLADISAIEKIRRASGMDADQLLIVLGYAAYGLKARERMSREPETGAEQS